MAKVRENSDHQGYREREGREKRRERRESERVKAEVGVREGSSILIPVTRKTRALVSSTP